MSDVERRLILGRGGEKTQKVEEEIVESLDEIIKKVEQQQQNSGGGGGQGGNQNQSGGAAGDSSVKGRPLPAKSTRKTSATKPAGARLPEKSRRGEERHQSQLPLSLPRSHRAVLQEAGESTGRERIETTDEFSVRCFAGGVDGSSSGGGFVPG